MTEQRSDEVIDEEVDVDEFLNATGNNRTENNQDDDTEVLTDYSALMDQLSLSDSNETKVGSNVTRESSAGIESNSLLGTKNIKIVPAFVQKTSPKRPDTLSPRECRIEKRLEF